MLINEVICLKMASGIPKNMPNTEEKFTAAEKESSTNKIFYLKRVKIIQKIQQKFLNRLK